MNMKQPAMFDIGLSEKANLSQQMYLDAMRYTCGVFSFSDEYIADKDLLTSDVPDWLVDLDERYSSPDMSVIFHRMVDFLLEQMVVNSTDILMLSSKSDSYEG